MIDTVLVKFGDVVGGILVFILLLVDMLASLSEYSTV
jgi:hypothetical protein